MAPSFLTALAAHLSASGPLAAKEAAHGDRLEPGRVLIVPGRKQVAFRSDGSSVFLRCKAYASQQSLIAPIDAIARRAADVFGAATFLLILTGMGNDGLEGARAVSAARGIVLAESEDSCVIYGMPREVAEAGLANAVLPLEAMAPMLAFLASKHAPP